MPLSDRQLRAAHRTGQDVCVVAGPGSGKTSVLIERFSWLVREQHIAPRRILAITFTEKAATEIRERLIRAFDDNQSLRREIERAWVSTIHSFCARLLRENAIEAAIDPEFAVLEQARRTLQDVADQVLESMYEEDPPRMRKFLRSLAVALERNGFVPDLATSLVEIYDAIRLAGASIESLKRSPADPTHKLERLKAIATEIQADRPVIKKDTQADVHDLAMDWSTSVLAMDHGSITEAHIRICCRDNWNKTHLVKDSAARRHEDELRDLTPSLRADWIVEYYAADRATIIDALERIDSEYRTRKRNSSMLDFDDLEESAIHLLKQNPGLRQTIRSEFDYILMDELQDTNPLQWKLIDLVRSEDRFFAVGDINQSIYGFRHAQPKLFGQYRDALLEAGLEVDELRDNYRTRGAVLDVVNRIFKGAEGIEPHELSPASEFAGKQQESVEIIAVFGQLTAETEHIEAQWVARRITELVGTLQVAGRPAKYGDIAVLTRANYSTAELQEALDLFSIPSVVVGGLTFYDTREVRDLGLVLDVLVNPENEIALAGLLRSPLFGLPDEELLRLVDKHESLEKGVRAEPPAAWDTILELRRDRNLVSPDRLLRRILDQCDYESGLTDRGRANVVKFLTALRERYERNPAPLAEIAAEIAEASPDAEAPPSDTGDAVRLMTIHKAKGLEFPIVFLPFLHKGRNIQTPVISFSHENGLGVKWRNPLNAENIPDHIAKANEDAARKAQTAEENRLLYVACTRAKEHLVLSWSTCDRDRGTWPGLIQKPLGLDLSTPSNDEIRKDGIRILTADRLPERVAATGSSAQSQLAAVLDPVTSPGHLDSAASVTDVSHFAECPRKYYLSRYLGQTRRPDRKLLTAEAEDVADPEESGPALLGAAELGVQVHALLAGLPVESPADEAVQLAQVFRSSPLARKLAKAARREYEWDFVFHTAGIVLRGQIDAWYEENGKLTIIDYKTDRNPDARTIDGHELQLRIYAMALEQATGTRTHRAVLYFLRSAREHEVDLSPLSMGAAREMVHRFGEAQRRTDFPLQVSQSCTKCEFFNSSCPAKALQAART